MSTDKALVKIKEEIEKSEDQPNNEVDNTSDEEDDSSQKREDPHISEDSKTDDYIDPKTYENDLPFSNYEGKHLPNFLV